MEYSPSYGSKKDACFRTLRDLAGLKRVMSTLCVLPSNISCASASPVAGPLLRIGDKGDRIKVQDLVVLKIWAPAEFPNKSDQQPCIDRRLQAPPQCKDHRPCHHKEFFESYICRDILCGGEVRSQTFFCTIMNILTKLRLNTQSSLLIPSKTRKKITCDILCGGEVAGTWLPVINCKLGAYLDIFCQLLLAVYFPEVSATLINCLTCFATCSTLSMVSGFCSTCRSCLFFSASTMRRDEMHLIDEHSKVKKQVIFF